MNKIIRPGCLTYDGKPVSVYCRIQHDGKRLSITGVIGPRKNGDAWGGCGQIDMEFDHLNKTENDSRYEHPIKAEDFLFAQGWNSDLWYGLLHVWKEWHLNDLHAECVHQELLGWTCNTHLCEPCPVCGYKLGSAWTFREVPKQVIEFLESLPETDSQPAWV